MCAICDREYTVEDRLIGKHATKGGRCRGCFEFGCKGCIIKMAFGTGFGKIVIRLCWGRFQPYETLDAKIKAHYERTRGKDMEEHAQLDYVPMEEHRWMLEEL